MILTLFIVLYFVAGILVTRVANEIESVDPEEAVVFVAFWPVILIILVLLLVGFLCAWGVGVDR